MDIKILLLVFMLLLIILSLIETHIKIIKYKNIRYLIFVIYIFICSFRGNYGSDTRAYKRLFFLIKDLNEITEKIPMAAKELGYRIVAKIFSYSNSIEIYFGFIAFLTIFFLTKFILIKNRYNYYLVLYIYVCRFFIGRDLNQMRSALAGILVLYSIIYYDNKIKYFITNLFSSLFQKYFIVFYIFSFFFNKIYSKKTYILILVVGIVLGRMNIIKKIMIRFENVLNANEYITGYYSINNDFFKNPIFYYQLIIVFMYLYKYKYIKFQKIEFNSYFTSLCILIYMSFSYGVSGRLSTIFATSEIILVPKLLKIYKIEKKIILKIFIIILYGIIFYLNLKRERIF